MNLARKVLLSLVAATGALSGVAQAADDGYLHEVQQWQQQRFQGLHNADGWLATTNSEALHKGTTLSIGSGADQDVILLTGPAHLGNLTYAQDGSIRLTVDKGNKVTIDNPPAVPGNIEPVHIQGLYFFPDGEFKFEGLQTNPPPTIVHINTATLKIYSYDGEMNAGEKRLLVTDTQSPRFTQFKAPEYFPIDPSWKVTATVEPLKTPREVEVAYVQGRVEKVPLKSKVTFVHDGKTYQLLPYMQAQDGEMLFVFADGTSGHETYGGARFLITEPAKDGKVVLDFNKAINPPCAFIPFPDCPIAIPDNRLKVRIEAGEKKIHEVI